MSFDLGDAYPAALDVFDASGVATNATLVTLTITKPDGTADTPSVTNPPSVTGQYRVTYVPAAAGRYVVRWVTTNPNTAYTDAFDVADALPDTMIPLASMKRLLGMDPANTADDEAIRDMLTAVTVALEDYKNETMVRRTFTQRSYVSPAQSQRLRLLNLPVISLTTLVAETPATTVWDVTGLYTEPDTGLVRVITGPAISGYVIATYVAGYQVIPPRYVEAGKTLFQHLWEARRGPGGVSGVIGVEEQGDYLHYTGMPRKVTEMLGPPFPQVM